MRIATYNVFNLQLGGLTGAVAKSTRAIKSLVWSINEIESDVVLLQEVADDGVLDQINNALAKPYKVARVMPGNDVRGFHQALLAREDCQSLSVEDFVAVR